APGGGYRAARVTPDAGALLPHRFTLTCSAPANRRSHRRSALCCPDRQVTPSWLSPAPCPVESRLSSTPSLPKKTGAAATQPAHRHDQGTDRGDWCAPVEVRVIECAPQSGDQGGRMRWGARGAAFVLMTATVVAMTVPSVSAAPVPRATSSLE